MPKKSIILIAVAAAVLALVFTIPVFATGCDDDTAAYNNRVAGQMMDRGDNAEGQGNGTMCQNRGNNGGGDCAGSGNCDGNGGAGNCAGDGTCDGGACDGANCTGAGAGDCDGTCDGDCATASDEVLCF